ncbi:hypothetical protein TKK_0003068 [Trichogramma kaykai]
MSLPPYPCQRCKVYFSSEDSFAHHHWHNHPSEPHLPYSDAIELESYPALTETSSHEPNLCRESLIEIDCFDQASVIEGSNTKHVCKVCHEVFIIKSLLTSHQKLVHPELLVHECAVCHKKFQLLSQLAKHQKQIHPKMLTHKCGVCRRKFLHPNDLIRHKKHCSNGKKHECNVCQAAFKLQKELTKHQKLTHPELLVHNCHYCNKKFLKEENLFQHKKDFHDSTS